MKNLKNAIRSLIKEEDSKSPLKAAFEEDLEVFPMRLEFHFNNHQYIIIFLKSKHGHQFGRTIKSLNIKLSKFLKSKNLWDNDKTAAKTVGGDSAYPVNDIKKTVRILVSLGGKSAKKLSSFENSKVFFEFNNYEELLALYRKLI